MLLIQKLVLYTSQAVFTLTKNKTQMILLETESASESELGVKKFNTAIRVEKIGSQELKSRFGFELKLRLCIPVYIPVCMYAEL